MDGLGFGTSSRSSGAEEELWGRETTAVGGLLGGDLCGDPLNHRFRKEVGLRPPSEFRGGIFLDSTGGGVVG